MADEELQEVVNLGRQALQGAFTLYRIYDIIKQKKESTLSVDTLQGMALNKPFVFNGDMTDLGWFYNNGALPKAYIDELEEDLRKDVLDTFNGAERDGFVKYDSERATYTLTDKGRELLCDDEFRGQIAKAQEEAQQSLLTKEGDVEVTFAFDGRMSDMAAFLTTDKINLSDLEEAGENVTDVYKRFNFLESRGLVAISEDGDITPTKQGLKFLESDTFKKTCAKEAIEKTAIKSGGEVVVGAVDKGVDVGLASAPTGVTQAVVITKKVAQVGKALIDTSKALTKE